MKSWSKTASGIEILKEAGIKPGYHILDYGCGPGSYIIDTARLVGESGMVYALNVHPLAIQMVRNLASKKKLTLQKKKKKK